jgi:hypothetical protein
MSARAPKQAAAKQTPPARHAPAPAGRVSVLRRCSCGGGGGGECAECRRKRLRRAGPSAAHDAHGGGAVPSVVRDVLGSAGHPLPPGIRGRMQSSFGHDFGRVRVHADGRAAESARAVGAHAYAVGPHVVFGAGRWAPETAAGRRLLAHELAHTVQDPGASGLHASLEIGPAGDPAEREADRAADAVASGGRAPALTAAGGGVVRRQSAEPAPVRTDIAHVPFVSSEGSGRIHVIRDLVPCECRRVPDVREGVFYNPDLDALAIAYRHCRGGRTTDVYADVESNLSSFLGGGPPPTGTARIGFEINVVGRTVSGRGLLEMRGSNVSGSEGVGGRAQVVFQGNRWRVFVTADFLHRLGAAEGDELTFDLGGRLGPITVEARITDALQSTRSIEGAGCVDIFGGRGCATITGGGETGGVTGGIQFRGTFGGPEVRREECYQCLCPPPAKRFRCYRDIPDTEEPATRDVDVEVPGEHRYYFALDRATPAEEGTLRGASTAGLDAVAREVAAGGSVVSVTGYASPEASEAHNARLSEARAAALGRLLRSRLPAGAAVPEPSAGGELLGNRPSPSPSSRLGEAIRAQGFRAAEDISILLMGEEIPHGELADQMVSLFQALPEPADRLALFGLGPGDPLAARVLTAVEEFLRAPRAGTRPWERVFRLLRRGVIRTTRTERRPVTEMERVPGSLTVVEEGECRALGERTERQMPPIPRELRMPRRGREDRDVECTIDVTAADRRRGCNYEVPPSMRLPATAPSRAPRRLP